MFGNGIAGFGSNVLRAATLLIWPDDESDENAFIGTMALYMFTAFVLAGCCIAQLFLKKNKFANFYLKKLEGSSSKSVDFDGDE